LEISSGEVADIGEGDYPAWSPDGNWIAFFAAEGSKCVLVRADGTTRRVLMQVRRITLLTSYKQLGLGIPVWSPDGQELLLAEMVGDDSMNVLLVRVQDGRELRRARKHLPAFGWAPLSTTSQK
jgi:Tol biopolymer transport system component